MMRTIIYTCFLLLPLQVLAVESVSLQSVDIDLSDLKSTQRGAKHYATYCLGCHSLKHIRYKRIATHLEIDDATVLADIAPKGASIYAKMHTAMDKQDAVKWFGAMPPDLSLIARSRSADWIYSYLKSFYTDKNKVLGVNNTVFKDVGMPNVLWKLQGIQTPATEMVEGRQVITYLKLTERGSLSPKEFDTMLTELVNFLVYVGEPTQQARKSVGKYVLLFFLLFSVIAYLLKKEYWKDVH